MSRWRTNHGGDLVGHLKAGWTSPQCGDITTVNYYGINHPENLYMDMALGWHISISSIQGPVTVVWHWDHWDSEIYETIIINIPPESRPQGDHCYDLGKGLCKRCTTPAVCPRPGPRECKPFFHFISNSCWSCEGWSLQLILIPYLCILDSISPHNNIPTGVLNF